MKDYSAQIANALISHFEDQEYRYEFDKERGIIRLNFKIQNKLNQVRFVLDIHDAFYVAYACINLNVDEANRKAVSEFFTRANFGLNFGNFELDMNDGEVRYKHTVDCDHCSLSSEMIERSLNIPIFMYQRYGDNMLKVMFGMVSPEEAVKLAESK